MQENRKMKVFIKYRDNRYDGKFKTERPLVHTHEELELFLLRNKRRKLISIDIFDDPEVYYDSKSYWTVYYSLEEYFNRECKGFDASIMAKEKKKEKAKYNKKLNEEIATEKYKTVADNIRSMCETDKGLATFIKNMRFSCEYGCDAQDYLFEQKGCDECCYECCEETILNYLQKVVKK